MISTMSRMRNEQGFTLIELMIVMVVLGILAGIVLFGVGTFSSDAETATTNANTRICKTAQAAFAARGYTGDFGNLFDGGTAPATCAAPVKP